MKLERRNWILLALVVLTLGAELLLRPPAPQAIDRTPLFPHLDPRAAHRVRIEPAHGEDAEPLELVREDGEWTLASWFGFPAHAWVVDDLLSRLRGTTRSDLVSADPTAAPVFGFDGSERTVTIEAEAGRALARLQVAAVPEGRGSHVRPLGTDEIFRAPALTPPDPSPGRFVEAALVSFDPARLEAIELEGGEEGKGTRFERLPDGRWRDASGERHTAATIDPLVAWASHLYLQEVVAAAPAAEHGLGGPDGVGRARLRLFEEGREEPHELVFGAAVPMDEGGVGERYVTNRGWPRPWVVTVSPVTSERLTRLLRRHLP